MHHVQPHALHQNSTPLLRIHYESRRSFDLITTVQMLAQSCSYGLGLHASCTTCSLMFGITTEGLQDRRVMRAARHALLSSRSSVGSELQLWPGPSCILHPSLMLCITTARLDYAYIMRAAGHSILSPRSKCWLEAAATAWAFMPPAPHAASCSASQQKALKPTHYESRRSFTLVSRLRMLA